MTRVYVARNLDGVNMAMVIAPHLREAATRMETTTGELRRLGWNYAGSEDRYWYLHQTHNHVVYRPIDHYPPFTYWRRTRWTRREVAAARTYYIRAGRTRPTRTNKRPRGFRP